MDFKKQKRTIQQALEQAGKDLRVGKRTKLLMNGFTETRQVKNSFKIKSMNIKTSETVQSRFYLTTENKAFLKDYSKKWDCSTSDILNPLINHFIKYINKNI